MKTIKLISVIILLSLISMSIFAMGENFEQDTLRIKTEDNAEFIIVLPDLSNLKDLEREVNSVMRSLDNVLENYDSFDTIINVSVNNAEQKIIIDGNREGANTKININMDSPETPKKPKSFHGFTTFSLGLNNYLEDGVFPNDNKEQYAVKHWGSWDVSLGGGLRWYIAKPISIDIAGDFSWNNFKFQDKSTRVNLDNNQIAFSNDTLGFNYEKSKITVPYVNASIIPMVHFGKKSKGVNRTMFRLGAGAYGGYRLGGSVKYIFNHDNTNSVYKNKDDYYLSSYRYGVKAVFGFNDFNLYASYNLNTLFAENKAPELNPISFGFNFIF